MKDEARGWLWPVGAVLMGAGFWFAADRLPVEVLLGGVLGGWVMVLVGWLAIPEERVTAPLRLGIYVGGDALGRRWWRCTGRCGACISVEPCGRGCCGCRRRRFGSMRGSRGCGG